MERFLALIDKLYQQKEQGASNAQLLATVQLLQAELLKNNTNNGSLGTSKVAVTMPMNWNFTQENITPETRAEEPIQTSSPSIEEIPVQELTASLADLAHVEIKKEELDYAPRPYILAKPAVEEKTVATQEQKQAPAQRSFFPAWEDTDEAPTLSQHQAREVHELISDVQESLNDRLKEEKVELAHRLKDTPIKDLRKGIGINDRFSFVSELFRGDEAMYERSIKTINGFNIFSEAEYWMSRELKLKLGWDEEREIVRHFYQIVRRRFS
jgi:hypothetical protein